MRKIDWDQPLSADDIAWLRQAGIQGIEDRIADNAAQFTGEDDDEDETTLLVLDPKTPETGADEDADDEGDDYDEWTAADLRDECQKRDITTASKAKRAELIAALRAYDVEHTGEETAE